MDWFTFLQSVLFVLVGMLIIRFSVWFHDFCDKPYRWSCKEPNCRFGVKSNDRDLTESFKLDHQQEHLPR